MRPALFGGETAGWVGRGTGVDDAGLQRKIVAIDKGLALHKAALGDPLKLAAALGGRELAAIMGATLAARHRNVPVLLDGFVCTAAVAPLQRLDPSGLAHTLAAHCSAEAGHRGLLKALDLQPLFDLGMRLGEGSGACLAVNIVRSALECHTGMASFAEAGCRRSSEPPMRGSPSSSSRPSGEAAQSRAREREAALKARLTRTSRARRLSGHGTRVGPRYARLPGMTSVVVLTSPSAALRYAPARPSIAPSPRRAWSA